MKIALLGWLVLMTIGLAAIVVIAVTGWAPAHAGNCQTTCQTVGNHTYCETYCN